MRLACLRRFLGVLVVAAVGVGAASQLGGCNTVKGLGRDVEAVAQGGQDIIDGKQ